MACILRPMVRTTYPDKGEHHPGRGFESAVCHPGGTQIESWRATCRMGECYAGLPRGRLGGSLHKGLIWNKNLIFLTLHVR